MRCEIFETNEKIILSSFLCVILKPTNYSNTPVEFERGRYKIELWGAEGGRYIMNNNAESGKGGYVSGNIRINKTQTFYFYIGGKGSDGGTDGVAEGGYNGGVRGGNDTTSHNCYPGGSGGATDMRIQPVTTDERTSLLSRVIVAGGGGSSGAYIYSGAGGSSGGIKGEDGESNEYGKGGSGGSQISGCSLGVGCTAENSDTPGGSGGGGYYGGCAGTSNSFNGSGGGGGGSSFISGHPDCIAMSEDGNQLQNSYHPSGIFFTNTKMIQGNKMMPNPYSHIDQINGNIGNGAVRITRIVFSHFCKVFHNKIYVIPFIFTK